MQTLGSRKTLRFGDFELDLAAYELRRHGRPVKLGRQPMDVLILLVENRKDVFVDVETGVNTAISKIRQALRDSTEAPAFLETVPGKGYRFIATVEAVSPVPPFTSRAAEADQAPAAISEPATVPATRPRPHARLRLGIGVLVALVPRSLGTWVLGEQWSTTGDLRAVFACAFVFQAAGTSAHLGLSATLPARLLRVRQWSAPLYLAAGLGQSEPSIAGS